VENTALAAAWAAAWNGPWASLRSGGGGGDGEPRPSLPVTLAQLPRAFSPQPLAHLPSKCMMDVHVTPNNGSLVTFHYFRGTRMWSTWDRVVIFNPSVQRSQLFELLPPLRSSAADYRALRTMYVALRRRVAEEQRRLSGDDAPPTPAETSGPAARPLALRFAAGGGGATAVAASSAAGAGAPAAAAPEGAADRSGGSDGGGDDDRANGDAGSPEGGPLGPLAAAPPSVSLLAPPYSPPPRPLLVRGSYFFLMEGLIVIAEYPLESWTGWTATRGSGMPAARAWRPGGVPVRVCVRSPLKSVWCVWPLVRLKTRMAC